MRNTNIEFIVRAVIVKRGKILLCCDKKFNYYYFPGGHVEFGEGAKQALKRELKEETNIAAKVGNLVGVVENFYHDKKAIHHEINLIFIASIRAAKVSPAEDHINFRWVTLKDISRTKILPKALKGYLLKWLKDGRIFWSTQNLNADRET